MYATYRDKYKQEKMRELMELIAKRRLAEQKMLIEKEQLKRDVSVHEQELDEYKRQIEDLQDEFNVEYAPDELDSSKMGIDDGYTKQNMLKEKTRMNESMEFDNSASEDEEDSQEDSSEESSEKKDRKTMKKELMAQLGQDGMIESDDAEKEV